MALQSAMLGKVRATVETPDENPYKSPHSLGTPEITSRTQKPPVGVSITLGVIGIAFLLLLNGQHFTNAVVFLGCILAGGGMWLRFLLVSSGSKRRRLAIVMVAFHAVLVLACAASLPERYSEQREFNDMTNKVRDLIRSYQQSK